MKKCYRLSLLGPARVVSVGGSAYCARHGHLCATPSPKVAAVKSLRVELTDTLAYWTVVDDDWVPVPVPIQEAEALLGVCRCWRDRFLLVLLWFCGLRVGEALGLRRSDLHLVPTATTLGCSTPGPHVHVVGRDNSNRARAKSGDRVVPVRAEVLSCYDRYLPERAACPAAEGCDFVLVNLAHSPLGQPMTTDSVRKWLSLLSARAGLERRATPHMFRHATATELLARGASIDVVKELLGHSSIRATEVYLHPDVDALRAAVDTLGPIDLGEAAR